RDAMLDETSSSTPLDEEPPREDAVASGEQPVVRDMESDGQSEEAIRQPDVGRPPSAPVRDRGRIAAIGVMGGLVAVGIGLIVASPRKPAKAVPSLALTGNDALLSADGGDAKAEGVLAASPPVVVTPAVPRPPPAWRVSSLKTDPNVEVTEGT